MLFFPRLFAGGLRFEFKLLKFSMSSPGTDTFLTNFALYGWTEGKWGGGNKSETGRGWMDGWKGSFVAGFFLEVNRLGGSSHGIMYIVLRILASAVRWCRCLREFKTLIFLSTPFLRSPHYKVIIFFRIYVGGKRMSFWRLTTSMICCSVIPKVSMSDCDSLSTGRSR